MDTNILLENGTNELEVLEFKVGSRHYGINVAKVREIITYQEVTPVPHAHPSIEGIFMPRGTMITAIDLKNCLQMGESEAGGLFIITNFNSMNLAFHVDSVQGIHRVSWADIMKPSATAASMEDGVSTGIIKKDDKIIIILDFEKIITDINPEIGLKVTEVERLAGRSRIDVPILIAEDSALLNRLIVQSLETAGYTHLTHTENGQQAWDLIQQWNNEGTLDKNVQCVITDIEMPQMDGHRLTKLIKSDERLKKLTVVIFSSMINDDLRRKGEQLGADAQLTKPEIGSLVAAVDKLLGVEAE
ncbi:MAG: chemotaxis protein CheV [Lachnospiraceae bacterium]|nr:chemotaxis protein CheV [Lachnospiraceae bacterium]